MQLPTTTSYLSIYLWVLVVYRAKIKIWNLVWIRNPSVQLCRVYRKPKIRSPPGWIPIKSPNYLILPMRVTYVQFQARNPSCQNLESVCEISMLPTSTTYLEVLEMCRVVVYYCVFNYGWKIQISRCWLPPVADLPLQKFKTKIAHKIEKIRETAIHLQFSPVGLVIFVSREYFILSCDHHHSTWLVFSRSFLGFKKTGCRRRNVLKEDLGAEDKTRKLVSSLWARLPGYGQKRPRYQWVPGFPMVWDMECLV